jgi:hypothetical protein
MQNDAEGAMVGVGVDGVDVGHLDEGEQDQQCQAQRNYSSVGFGPCASVTAHPCLKSSQTLNILVRRAWNKFTQDWMRQVRRSHCLKELLACAKRIPDFAVSV